MKIWVMKYALSEGVRVCEGRVTGSMAVVNWPGGMNGVKVFHGGSFQTNADKAETRFKEMVATRKKSLARQMKKLEDLEAAGEMPMWEA